MSNQTLNIAAIQAEQLYNGIQYMYINTLSTEASDALLNNLKIEYNTVLEFLNNNGIGGVRINNVFRFTNKENCPNWFNTSPEK